MKRPALQGFARPASGILKRLQSIGDFGGFFQTKNKPKPHEGNNRTWAHCLFIEITVSERLLMRWGEFRFVEFRLINVFP